MGVGGFIVVKIRSLSRIHVQKIAISNDRLSSMIFCSKTAQGYYSRQNADITGTNSNGSDNVHSNPKGNEE